MESVIPALTKQRREAQLRRWMEALPEEVFAARPVLANGYVGALMSTGEIRGVEPRLRIAEGWVEAARAEPAGTLPAGLLVAPPDQFRKLPGWVKIHRAGLALMVGDASATVDHAREAIAVLDPDDDLGHGAATALMGLASWRQGDLAAAEAAYAETIRRFEQVGYVADILGCAVTMAELQLTLGRLRAAERTFRDGARPRRAPDHRARPRHARHARRAEHGPRRARRPRGRPGAPPDSPTSSATTSACRSTRTAGASPRPASARPTAT